MSNSIFIKQLRLNISDAQLRIHQISSVKYLNKAGFVSLQTFIKVWWCGGLAGTSNQVIRWFQESVCVCCFRVHTCSRLHFLLHQASDVQHFLWGSGSKLVHAGQRSHPLQLEPGGCVQCQQGLRSCNFVLPLPARQQPAQIWHAARAQLPHWHIS